MRPPARGGARKSAPRRTTQAPRAEQELFPIVGIGASAGGLEAFTQLLGDLPPETGMGYVFVQHLAPRHESMLSELLRRATKIPITEVKDGMAVEPDHIYVIPPNTDLAIKRGVLHLVSRGKANSVHMPIDYFFASLAQDRKANAIGVILSGSASDGTLGLKAIKTEGGVTFAQLEKSAKYDSMPKSAIDSGFVDFVAAPSGIAKELARIARHPYVRRARATEADEPLTGDDRRLNQILALIRKATGDDFSNYKRSTIQRRIMRRMVLKNVSSLRQYFRQVNESRDEVLALYQDLLIHVTGFFRTPEAFEGLKEKVFPKLLARRSDSPIRIWVPACSTGEEAYSIVIALQESILEAKRNTQIQIFATDISEPAIKRARTGRYSDEIAVDVSPERLNRFFVKVQGGYQVIKPVRDLCVFARQNVFSDPPFSNLDLISCRNLLIYLDSPLQRKVFPLFHYALNTGGHLLLGTSESASGELFVPVDSKTRIYAKRATSVRPDLGLALPGFSPERAIAKRKGEAPGLLDVQKETEQILLSRYTPPGVVINNEMEILHFHGRTGRYLESPAGSATLSLPKMVREGLGFELRNLVQSARKRGVPVKKNRVPMWSNGDKVELCIEVIPLKGAGEKPCFLVLFRETAVAKVPATKSGLRKGGKGQPQDRTVALLRRELEQTKAHMESIIQEQESTNEELRSASEEIQSSNEELQSTNEELETAQEELQSTNEELTTLNEELQTRNYELNTLNSDLINLSANVDVPVIMLRGDLRIRRVSPAAEKLLNIIPSDLGRPISDLKIGIDVADLETLVSETIAEVSPKEREVQDRQGRWHSLRIRPYKTPDNRIDGVVMTLLDIDRAKEGERKSRALSGAMAAPCRDCILLLDEQLRVKAASRSFLRIFQATADQIEGRFLSDLGNGQWNIPRLRDLLERVLKEETEVQEFIVEHDFPSLGHRVMVLSASSFRLQSDGPALILLSVDDITARRQAELAVQEHSRLLDLVGDAVFICDLNHRIEYWNLGAERLYGWDRENAIGKNALDLLKTKASQSSDMIKEAVLREQHWEGDLERTHRNGSSLRMSARQALRMDDDGKPLGWLDVSRPLDDKGGP